MGIVFTYFSLSPKLLQCFAWAARAMKPAAILWGMVSPRSVFPFSFRLWRMSERAFRLRSVVYPRQKR